MERIIKVSGLIGCVGLIVLAVYCGVLTYRITSMQNELSSVREAYDQAGMIVTVNDERISEIETLFNELKHDLSVSADPVYEEYKRQLSDKIESGLASIIKTPPTYEGQWLLTDIKFLSPCLVTVTYEDGHKSETSLISVIPGTKNGPVFRILN